MLVRVCVNYRNTKTFLCGNVDGKKLLVYKLLASQLERECRLEKKNQDPALGLMAYALMWSFSHTSHRFGHDSSSPIAVTSIAIADKKSWPDRWFTWLKLCVRA